MSVKKLMKAIFAKTERKHTAVALDFQQLQQTLRRASKPKDPSIYFDAMVKGYGSMIRHLIEMYEIINDGKYDDELKRLKNLQTKLANDLKRISLMP